MFVCIEKVAKGDSACVIKAKDSSYNNKLVAIKQFICENDPTIQREI